MRDKIAVPVDPDVADMDCMPALRKLVAEGYLVWLDQCHLKHGLIKGRSGRVHGPLLNCDIYLLTPKGVELCDTNGIHQR